MTVHTDTELTNSEWYNQELANKNSHRTHLVIKKRKRCNLVFFFWRKDSFPTALNCGSRLQGK